MTGTDWLVVAAAAAAIGWVNWYFFVAGRSAATVIAAPAGPTAAGAPDESIAEATIVVNGGYAPSTIRVQAGRPVRLVFDRQDTSSCSEEVVFPDFGLRKYLPTGKKTTVELTPPRAGTYEFMCGMSMLRGTLVAEDRQHA